MVIPIVVGAAFTVCDTAVLLLLLKFVSAAVARNQ